MYNISELFADGVSIVRECCGDIIGDIVDVRPNYRAKSRWGCCKHNLMNDTYIIEIASKILADDIDYDKVMSVMIHEILHATIDSDHHGPVWRGRAYHVMRKYPQYEITRCQSAEYFGLESSQQSSNYKYAIQCMTCDRTHRSTKLSKSIKHPDWYRCKCGGKLIRLQNEQTKLI